MNIGILRGRNDNHKNKRFCLRPIKISDAKAEKKNIGDLTKTAKTGHKKRIKKSAYYFWYNGILLGYMQK